MNLLAQTFQKLTQCISFSGAIHVVLGKFANLLDNLDGFDSLQQIKEILKTTFSNNTNHELMKLRPYFVQVVKRKDWTVLKKLILPTKLPLQFYVQEDQQNETILHLLARNQDCQSCLEKLLKDDHDIKIIWKAIIDRSQKRKDFPTPLETAIKYQNSTFISKIFLNLKLLIKEIIISIVPKSCNHARNMLTKVTYLTFV